MVFSLKRRQAVQAVAPGVLEPRDVATLYGLDRLHSKGIFGQGERIGFLEFSRPSAADDAAFWRRYSVAPNLNRPVRTIVVDLSPSDPGALDETDLDVQYAGALAPGAELLVYLIDDEADVPTFMGQVYDALRQAAADGVHIVSISLGTSDALAGQAGPIFSRATGNGWTSAAEFASALDALLSGMLVFAAAGDSGAYGGLPFGDTDPQPIWPAVQGRIVAVGGTQLAVPGDVTSGEQAWGGQVVDPSRPAFNPANTLPQASGGGGVSGFLPAPSYQPDAEYRNTPDIAAIAGPLAIVDRGVTQPIWGTSASAPVAAAIAALVHQATGRLLDHPTLYNGATDITSGNDWNSTLVLAGLDVFYCADVGYDLCTGAGVLKVAALLDSLHVAPPSQS